MPYDPRDFTITYADGWAYTAPIRRCKPQRLNRILGRLRQGASLDAALIGMAPCERQWVIGFVRARMAHEKAGKAEAARAKVEAWKAENT